MDTNLDEYHVTARLDILGNGIECEIFWYRKTFFSKEACQRCIDKLVNHQGYKWHKVTLISDVTKEFK